MRRWRNGPKLNNESAKGKQKLERTVGKADPKKSCLFFYKKGRVNWRKVVGVNWPALALGISKIGRASYSWQTLGITSAVQADD